jgi:hypothetical protein
MIYYSFNDKILTRDSSTIGNLFDLTKTTVTDKELSKLKKYTYVVPIEKEGRLDLISKDIYDSTNYVEELMKINNILNEFSIKAYSTILYVSYQDLQNLYDTTGNNVETNSSSIDVLNINNPKNTVVDANRKNTATTTVIKDKNTKQIYWNKDNKTITISNKLS